MQSSIRRELAALCLAVGLAMLLAVTIATSSSTAKATTKSATTAKAGALPPYTGPEAKLPTSYPTPTIKKGVTFRLGFLSPQSGVQSLDEEESAAIAEAKKLGGTAIAYAVNSNPATQVADFKLLISQHATAMAFQPLDPPALAPEIKVATKAGIPLVTPSTPAAATQANAPGYSTDVLQGEDECAYAETKAVAEAKPHATYAIISTALPYPSLQYLLQRIQYWAIKDGLHSDGSVSTGSALPASAGSTAMSAIIARHPNVNAVFAWYDPVAEGAATTQKLRAGGHIMVVGNNGDSAAVQLVKKGTMFGTCQNGFAAIGREMAIAAYDEQTKQHLPLPAKIVIPVKMITKANA
jgi:ABC-type sugar transport system substrate-binding protein